MKIQSRIDVITNSSTEVFCYKRDSQEYKDLCEFLGPVLSGRFETVDSLEDVWKRIDSGDYYEGLFHSSSEQSRFGNYGEWNGVKSDPFDSYNNWELSESMNKLVEAGVKTKREIFDFFAPIYKEALNVAYYSFETDGCYDKEFEDKVDEFYAKRREEEILELFSQFKEGDILQFTPRTTNWKKSVIATFISDDCSINSIYFPIGPEYSEDYMFCDTPEKIKLGISMIDILSAKLATPKQIEIYNKIKKQYENSK